MNFTFGKSILILLCITTLLVWTSCKTRLKCHECCNLYYVSTQKNGWRYTIHKSDDYRTIGYNITRSQNRNGKFYKETLIQDSVHYVAVVKDFFAWHGTFVSITTEDQDLLQRMSRSCKKVLVELRFQPQWLGWYDTSPIK
jgi:hypothetical protein